MKRITIVVFASLLLTLAGCATKEPPPTANAPNLVPKKLEFYIVDISGPSYDVKLDNEGYVVYSVKQPGQKSKPPLHRAPTPEQWQEFRHQLDHIKIWDWKPEYGSKLLIDGTQWSIDIEYADHSVHSDGHRDFPDSGFDGLLQAIGKLLGSGQVE
jgi:hypothetical protein